MTTWTLRPGSSAFNYQLVSDDRSSVDLDTDGRALLRRMVPALVGVMATNVVGSFGALDAWIEPARGDIDNDNGFGWTEQRFATSGGAAIDHVAGSLDDMNRGEMPPVACSILGTPSARPFSGFSSRSVRPGD